MPTFRMNWTKAEDTMSDRYRIEICGQTYEMVCPLPDQYHIRSYVSGKSGQIVVADTPTEVEDQFIDWIDSRSDRQWNKARKLSRFVEKIPQKKVALPSVLKIKWQTREEPQQWEITIGGLWFAVLRISESHCRIEICLDMSIIASVRESAEDCGTIDLACVKAENKILEWLTNSAKSFQSVIDTIPR